MIEGSSRPDLGHGDRLLRDRKRDVADRLQRRRDRQARVLDAVENGERREDREGNRARQHPLVSRDERPVGHAGPRVECDRADLPLRLEPLLDPIEDAQTDRQYRRELAGTMVYRALAQACMPDRRTRA